MKNISSNCKLLVVFMFLFFVYAGSFAQSEQTNKIDIKTARAITDSLDQLYSKYLFEGDSTAIFAMYAKDAYLNSSKGNDILHAISNWIQYSIKTNTRTVVFTTTTLTIDGEFIIETGTTEGKDDKGDVKYKSKYLVVWKPENGTWKLYRDISL